ncbi:MAG: hypothetical protein U1F56_14500 [Rubrivivax sp.]
MNPLIGWGLALAAFVAGWLSWGWRGLLMAFSAVVFWLLLQFSRGLRVLRQAGGRPVGSIDNAVMLHAKLRTGMRLLEILPLTRSLGRQLADDPETYVWTDAGGDRVRVELRAGRCTAFALERAGAEPPAP